MKRSRTYIYYLLLFLTAVMAMLPLAQLLHPLKYDIIDQAYPWRYFIGECLQEGILPLWNPYQLLGSPIHADPQSSAWYPVTWFFGFLSGYDIYVISIDFLLHIFLAGMGMFYLGRQLALRDETAFLMGVSYMLSGFFIGNAQHFMWIISGTWIPFIIGAFIHLKNHPSFSAAIRLGLAFFMLMTGGYPAFVFLLIYLLLAIFILYVFEYTRKKDFRGLFRYSKYLLFAAIYTILTGTVVLISVYFLQGAITRGDGVTLQQALFGAFTPRSFISFLFPFAAIRDMDFYGTDLSMSNAYLGLLTLIFFITGLMMKRTKLINVFLGWGIFCLAASVGSALPVREFLYDYLPFMDLFRFPALFRIFFILSFIIVAGLAFDEWMKNKAALSRKLIISLTIVAGLIIGLTIYALLKGNLDFAYFVRNQLLISSNETRIGQHIFFQGLIQLIFLIFFLLLITRWVNIKNLTAAILLLVTLDLVVATRLNGPYTVYTQHHSSKEIYHHAKEYPDGFPVPGSNALIENRDTKGMAFQSLWRNLNIFHKQVSYEGYNPLHLKGFEKLADEHPRLFETILQNPLVYLSDQISPLDSLSAHEVSNDYERLRVYLDEEDYRGIFDAGWDRGKGNEKQPEGNTLLITGFSPVELNVFIRTKGDVLVNLLQNNYHGWKAKIDGQPTAIYTGNMSFLSVKVPTGEHELVFLYDPNCVRVGFWISLFTVLAGVIVLVTLRVFDNGHPQGIR